MIVIYCSTFGLRSIYKVSALLLIISGLLTTDNAVRIQVAQLERLSSEGRFFFRDKWSSTVASELSWQ